MRRTPFFNWRPLLLAVALLSLAAVEGTAQRASMELLETNIAATQTAINIDGQVKNISPREVSGVEVYCNFQNMDGESIRIERGYLDTDPLAAGETSTFKISTKYDANIKRFNVTFRRTFGGPLVIKDSREQ